MIEDYKLRDLHASHTLEWVGRGTGTPARRGGPTGEGKKNNAKYHLTGQVQ